ncbi:aldehyde dehydrogenase family protein [Rhodococcus hoagii]|nr:aldehyde dehydrogenase family protein [Prescottella equi]
MSKDALDRVDGYVQIGVDEVPSWSSTAAASPSRTRERILRRRNTVRPPRPRDADLQEEIFGPVLQVVRAHDYEEALRLPTEHEYGNGVAIFTRDGDTARPHFCSRVEVGMVGVNVRSRCRSRTTPSWLEALRIRRPNQHGPDSIRFYNKTQTVTQRWPSGFRSTLTTSSSRRWTDAVKRYVPSWHDDEVRALSELAAGFFEREVVAHNERWEASAASTATCCGPPASWGCSVLDSRGLRRRRRHVRARSRGVRAQGYAGDLAFGCRCTAGSSRTMSTSTAPRSKADLAARMASGRSSGRSG